MNAGPLPPKSALRILWRYSCGETIDLDALRSLVGPEWHEPIERMGEANGHGRTAELMAAIGSWPNKAAIDAAIFKLSDVDEADQPIPPLQRIWAHDELLAADFPQPTFIVEGLIPDAGLTLLSGKRKKGKSWLALQLSQCGATGTPLLGRTVQRRRVLLFMLEDGPIRTKARLKAQHAPEGLDIHYRFSLRPLDQDGLAELARIIEEVKPGLVVIDPLSAAKTGKVDENSAGPISEIMNGLRQLAQEFSTAIVLVVHQGKATTGDVGDDIRGSSAFAAAADATLALYKDGSGFTLKAEGRDIEEVDVRIAFDAGQTWSWQLIGDSRQIVTEEIETSIINAVQEFGECDASAVAREVHRDRSVAQRHLKDLRQKGRLLARADGQRVFYRLPEGLLPPAREA